MGISYAGRTYEEGTKIEWRDGVPALYCIVCYSRFFADSKPPSLESGPAAFAEADVELTVALDSLQGADNDADGSFEMPTPPWRTSARGGAGQGTLTERIARPGTQVVATELSERGREGSTLPPDGT